jgi:hypothetical protein
MNEPEAIAKTENPHVVNPAADLAPDLVGLDEHDARSRCEAAGLACRVTKQDGQGMVGTMDYRPDRIGLVLLSGKVVAASVG